MPSPRPLSPISPTPRYRWIIVASGGLMGCVAIGAMFSLAVFLGPMSESTGWSRAAISSAMTIDFLVMGIAGFGWGALSDRIGVRPVVLCGAILLGAGLLIASRATTLLAFQLGYGVLIGLAAGAFFAPIMASVTAWFESQRALAVSLVSAGMGMAPLTISPFAGWLISHYDWRTALGVLGVGAWALLIPTAFLLRRPPPATAFHSSTPKPENSSRDLGRALRSTPFLVLGGTYFLCCAAHSGPIFHMMSYAQFCGLSTMTAVSVYSVEGLAGLGGRLLFGLAADRLGVKRVIITGLLVQAVAIATFVALRRSTDFYLLAIVFGAAYGGVMPLYAVLAREYFSQHIMGAVLGAATMLSCLGMALGPLVGGWIFDTLHNYRWLYLGSAAVAVGAVSIAFAFPRVPRPALANAGA